MTIDNKDGAAFLAYVTDKLETRIAHISQSILEGQKDIEGMHEYYWENYTEMDQYGYENFDNQQALLHQINANEQQIHLRKRFRKMLDSPFFGRVDFVFEGDEEPEIFYIGIGNFAEEAGHTPLIYDWRAPVSGLFYDYDKGPASYQAPLGTICGEIASKWQYKIRNGRMLYQFESDVKIDDEILMAELGSAEYPKTVNIRGYKPNTSVHMGQLKKALKMLQKAKKPLFLAGGGVNIANANEIFTSVVEKTQVPVVTTVMGRGAISTKHPLFIGNLGMHGAYAANMAVTNCDLLFSIGTRFNDRITGKLHEFAPNAQIVHIDIDTASISRNIHVDVPIVADAKEAITKMAEYVTECNTKKWRTEIDIWKNEHPLSMKNRPLMGPLDIFNEINKQFDKVIIVTDVGQHQMLTSQFVDITENRKLIMSGGLGTMGYGLPGAIGAQIGNPGVPVISISGDGGMQMNIQELATAVLEELPIINCIFNNTYLGMVRQWQKLFYGKRYSMTNLRSGALSRRTNGEEYPKYTPDFIKLAESYGAKGIRVTKREEIAAAFEEARKSTKVPTVIEFIIDPEEMVYPMVKPGGTLADLIMDC